jgi:hypothetical protein
VASACRYSLEPPITACLSLTLVVIPSLSPFSSLKSDPRWHGHQSLLSQWHHGCVGEAGQADRTRVVVAEHVLGVSIVRRHCGGDWAVMGSVRLWPWTDAWVAESMHAWCQRVSLCQSSAAWSCEELKVQGVSATLAWPVVVGCDSCGMAGRHGATSLRAMGRGNLVCEAEVEKSGAGAGHEQSPVGTSSPNQVQNDVPLLGCDVTEP